MNRQEVTDYFDPLIAKAREASEKADAAAPHLLVKELTKGETRLTDIVSSYTVMRTLEMTREDLLDKAHDPSATVRQDNADVPDPLSHQTGWEAKEIDGLWRVGMRGNLDTVHDAVVTVHQHRSDDSESKAVAEWIARVYNAALGK